jgi:hypothetical protein
MANTKISALTSATTPLAGTEVFPIVQTGVTVKTTINSITANGFSTAGSITLTGGTANGVTYLNGSKVLTSGTALVFDGTNLGIGTSSPSAKLTVAGGQITVTNSGVVNPAINFAGNGSGASGFQLGQNYNSQTFFVYDNAASSQRLTLDSSGNLGVGTSSPSNKLVVSNSGAAGLEIAPLLRDNVTAGASLLSYNRSGAAFVPMQFSGLDLRFLTSDTERLRIDGTGAFGINGANYGTSGQVLTSAGSGAAPSWATPTAGVTKQQAIAYSMFF